LALASHFLLLLLLLLLLAVALMLKRFSKLFRYVILGYVLRVIEHKTAQRLPSRRFGFYCVLAFLSFTAILFFSPPPSVGCSQKWFYAAFCCSLHSKHFLNSVFLKSCLFTFSPCMQCGYCMEEASSTLGKNFTYVCTYIEAAAYVHLIASFSSCRQAVA
jgi:hypothetical protein